MALHHRVALIDTLLEEAEQKRAALTHALNARERVEQGEESTHGAPLTIILDRISFGEVKELEEIYFD